MRATILLLLALNTTAYATTNITVVFAAGAAGHGVVGRAEGFASGVKGGGNVPPVYPRSNQELVRYLADSSPRVIILTRNFDFRGTEGRATEGGCAPWGMAVRCQKALNANEWCSKYHANAPRLSVTYDKAGRSPIVVRSNKSLVGHGTAGVIRGKGLKINGAKNVIVQNVWITDVNPAVVWGGDAISIDNADMVWVDHVKHLVLGTHAAGRVTISNCEFDGRTHTSATCDNRHHWGLFFNGARDFVTLKGNYVHDTSGRSPKVNGATFLHAVNNVFDRSAKAFDDAGGARLVVEGNVFRNIQRPRGSAAEARTAGKGGRLFSGDSDINNACQPALGRPCVRNQYLNAEPFRGADTNVVRASSAFPMASAAQSHTVMAHVLRNAGYGKMART